MFDTAEAHPQLQDIYNGVFRQLDSKLPPLTAAPAPTTNTSGG